MFNSTVLIFSCLLCVLFLILRTNGQSQGSRSEKEKDKIRLYHYPNPQNTTERYDLGPSLQNAKLTKGKRMKIFVHGAGSHCLKDDVPYRITSAYLRAKGSGKEDYNVLCLDYGLLEQQGIVPGDPFPTLRSRYEYICNAVSERATSLIVDLKTNGYISSFDKVHIIGHSLGGQVSGYIGRKIQEETGESIGRITGLDIANIFLVYSNEVNLHNQLDISDAKFVDIIHTSLIGLRGNYGHVDFYPDGGIHQMSCMTKGPVSNVTELIIGGCSHAIVGKYWEFSIDSPNITACKDMSWEAFQRKSNACTPADTVIFGEYVPTTVRGKYYLQYPLIKP